MSSWLTRPMAQPVTQIVMALETRLTMNSSS
jgi:hypothetical protein